MVLMVFSKPAKSNRKARLSSSSELSRSSPSCAATSSDSRSAPGAARRARICPVSEVTMPVSASPRRARAAGEGSSTVVVQPRNRSDCAGSTPRMSHSSVSASGAA